MKTGNIGVLAGIITYLAVRQNPLWGQRYLATAAALPAQQMKKRSYFILAGMLFAMAAGNAGAGLVFDHPIFFWLAAVAFCLGLALSGATTLWWKSCWDQWLAICGRFEPPTGVILLRRRQKYKGKREQFLVAVKVRGGGWNISQWFSNRKLIALYLERIFALRDCLIVFTAELSITDLRRWAAVQTMVAKMTGDHLFETMVPLPPR